AEDGIRDGHVTGVQTCALPICIRGWQWWRKVMLPGIFPYYVTGAITASGGAWNASIVSEFVSWGQDKVVAHGLGAYIAQTTAARSEERRVGKEWTSQGCGEWYE